MFNLPNLPYNNDALGSYLSEELMKFHHDMHHQAYVDKLNVAIDVLNVDLGDKTLDEILIAYKDNVAIRNNGGGHYNHSLFWNCMSPNGGGEPSGAIAKVIADRYGSYQNFVDEFSAKALSVFGSGWTFLQPNGEIINTPNQDTPILMGLDSPVLCLDVWEHAYYIDYRNRRADYIKAWWNIVDWKSAEQRLKHK